MVPGQTADTEYSVGSKLCLHGEVMDAFSWPLPYGRPARRSDFPAPWQLSNQTDQALLALELCQCAGDIGFELLADHNWSFSTKLIKSWLQF